jgi:hypothetical protein
LQAVVEKVEVALGVFVNLFDHYHGQMVLRMTHSDGSVVDPTLEGYTLHNISWNEAVPPYGAKSASFFIIQKQFQYTLSLKGQCVWSYGRATSQPRGFTSVSRFSLSFFVCICLMNIFLGTNREPFVIIETRRF